MTFEMTLIANHKINALQQIITQNTNPALNRIITLLITFLRMHTFQHAITFLVDFLPPPPSPFANHGEPGRSGLIRFIAFLNTRYLQN